MSGARAVSSHLCFTKGQERIHHTVDHVRYTVLETGGDGRKVVLELCEGVLSERDSLNTKRFLPSATQIEDEPSPKGELAIST